jgi:hypothetical protein
MAAQLFGNAGREHMEKYGTKPEHFAKEQETTSSYTKQLKQDKKKSLCKIQVLCDKKPTTF